MLIEQVKDLVDEVLSKEDVKNSLDEFKYTHIAIRYRDKEVDIKIDPLDKRVTAEYGKQFFIGKIINFTDSENYITHRKSVRWSREAFFRY